MKLTYRHYYQIPCKTPIEFIIKHKHGHTRTKNQETSVYELKTVEKESQTLKMSQLFS